MVSVFCFRGAERDPDSSYSPPYSPCASNQSEGVSHEESWSFYPNAVRTAGFCGNPSFHLYWPNKNQDNTHNILATRELIVQPGYILQFKVRHDENTTCA